MILIVCRSSDRQTIRLPKGIELVTVPEKHLNILILLDFKRTEHQREINTSTPTQAAGIHSEDLVPIQRKKLRGDE